jgi:hypothetical protein
MQLADRGTPVAVKHKALQRSTKLKTSVYIYLPICNLIQSVCPFNWVNMNNNLLYCQNCGLL